MPDLKLSFPNLVYAFSQRSDRNMSLFYGDTRDSLNNRKTFLGPLNIDYRSLVAAKQVHASNIRYVDKRNLGSGALTYTTAIEETDSLVTDEKNVPLAIFTADCLSLFLYDPKRAAVGLVHAGWHSTREKVSSKTVKFMQDRFGTDPQDLCAVFGPAIRSCCYEVSADFNGYFSLGLTEKEGRLYLDLGKINKEELLDSGLKKEQIFDPEICTFCQKEAFFSYRREGSSCGRMMSVAMLTQGQRSS